MSERVISWFSCGAASAISTVFGAIKYGKRLNTVYCRVREEHPWNMDFISEFQKVTGISVEIIENEKYQGSIYNVFLKRGFIKNQFGAPCTMCLKRDMRKQYQRSTDIQLFGYTVEEQHRIDRFIDANNDVDEEFPLLNENLTKGECHSLIQSLGLSMSPMYQLGYPNNNCIGCVKGGMGYWNAIRDDFPASFKRMSDVERVVGHSVCKDGNGPVYLDELERGRGNFKRDVPGDCGFTCEMKS